MQYRTILVYIFNYNCHYVSCGLKEIADASRLRSHTVDVTPPQAGTKINNTVQQ